MQATTAAATAGPLARTARRQAWTGAALLAFLLLVAVKAQSGGFDSFEIQTMLTSTLALGYLTLAQGVIVIGGGIDLSVGAQMVLFNCLSARLMEGQPFGTCLLIAAVATAAGGLLGALTGLVIAKSGVPDIIVTLATSFVWSGLALLVMPTPGGGTALEFQALVLGSGTEFWPPLVGLAVPGLIVWYVLRRTRAGLGVYAFGSNREAAFLAGVPAARTRITAYAIGGLLCALGGLAATAFTAGGDPRATAGMTATLTSVAAIVLGGIALTGGVGGLLGPVTAVWSLYLIPAIMLARGVDPAYGEAVKGVVIVLVVLLGGLLRRERKGT
ncbi:ABC transporter permease [Nonomuraea sp. M3C6]|uniref:Autoinducer 2 import system permease protein LsrD n=1 Tax=Nonomuraea marmarensis TaxID=3351344 RepID=A0ABW7ATC9_9ACTN